MRSVNVSDLAGNRRARKQRDEKREVKQEVIEDSISNIHSVSRTKADSEKRAKKADTSVAVSDRTDVACSKPGRIKVAAGKSKMPKNCYSDEASSMINVTCSKRKKTKNRNKELVKHRGQTNTDVTTGDVLAEKSSSKKSAEENRGKENKKAAKSKNVKCAREVGGDGEEMMPTTPMGGERKVNVKAPYKGSEGKKQKADSGGKKLNTGCIDTPAVFQKATNTEVRSVHGKKFKRETVDDADKKKAKATVTSIGTQTGDGNIKEEAVEEEVWKKNEISCSTEKMKDSGRKKRKHKSVGLDGSSAIIKREVVDEDRTITRIKREESPKRTVEERIDELTCGGNTLGHKKGKRKKQKAHGTRKEVQPETGTVKEAERTVKIKNRVTEQGSEREGNETERGLCEEQTLVHERHGRIWKERDLTRKKHQLHGRTTAEEEDSESRRPRQSEWNLAGAAKARADEHRLRKRKKNPESLVENGEPEKRMKMQSLSQLLTSHADVVFLSEKLGNRDEIVIDQARRLALQREIDLASC